MWKFDVYVYIFDLLLVDAASVCFCCACSFSMCFSIFCASSCETFCDWLMMRALCVWHDWPAHSYVNGQQLPMSSFTSLPVVNAMVGGGQSTTTTTTTDVNNSALGSGAPVSLPPMSQPQPYQNGSVAPASMPQGYSSVAPPVGGMALPPGMSYQPSPQQPLLWRTKAIYVFFSFFFWKPWLGWLCVCAWMVPGWCWAAAQMADAGTGVWPEWRCLRNSARMASCVQQLSVLWSACVFVHWLFYDCDVCVFLQTVLVFFTYFFMCFIIHPTIMCVFSFTCFSFSFLFFVSLSRSLLTLCLLSLKLDIAQSWDLYLIIIIPWPTVIRYVF